MIMIVKMYQLINGQCSNTYCVCQYVASVCTTAALSPSSFQAWFSPSSHFPLWEAEAQRSQVT